MKERERKRGAGAAEIIQEIKWGWSLNETMENKGQILREKVPKKLDQQDSELALAPRPPDRALMTPPSQGPDLTLLQVLSVGR